MASFCRFTVGTEGASAANLRYIARPDAVKERFEGAFFRNVPKDVLEARTYRELRQSLEAHAWARQESEQAMHEARGSRGVARSHYRCVLSFEEETATPAIIRMAEEWLRETMPSAVACGFVHRNTERVHAHLHIDARGVDGKKLDFSPRQWRQIGAKWDRIYTRELERTRRLESRFNELGGPQAEQGRAARAGGRADDGARKGEEVRARLTPGEQAARACASSRERAFRGARELRHEIERVARERVEARGPDRGREGGER